MANISRELTSIANDIYGEQVRTSIRTALNKMNTKSGGGTVANIASELSTIQNATYGRDMRGAIYSALDTLNQAIEDEGGGGGGSSVDTLVLNVSDGSGSSVIELSQNGNDLKLYISNALKDTIITPIFDYLGGTNPLTGSFGSSTFTFQPESYNNTIPNSGIEYGNTITLRFNGESSEEYRYLRIKYHVSGGEQSSGRHEFIVSVTGDNMRTFTSYSDDAVTEVTVVNSMNQKTITGIKINNPNNIAIGGSYSGSSFTIPASSNYTINGVSIGYGQMDTFIVDNNSSGSNLSLSFEPTISGTGPDLQKHVELFTLTTSDHVTTYSYSDGRDTDLLIVNAMPQTTIFSIMLWNNTSYEVTGSYSGTDFSMSANSHYSLTNLNFVYGDDIEVIINKNTLGQSLSVTVYFNTNNT